MTADRPTFDPGEWVLLSYRMPREPSTPRITLWRKLKRLGVAQLSDGLVALPADARTREQLEWIADEAIQAGDTASLWIARPATHAQERELTTAMAAARAAEYQAVIDQAVIDQATKAVGTATTAAVVRRLRAGLRRIGRRDFFPPLERDRAHAAVRALADEPGGKSLHAAPKTASYREKNT